MLWHLWPNSSPPPSETAPPMEMNLLLKRRAESSA